MKRTIFSERAPAPVGPYSQAVLANGVLYCAGQIAADCANDAVAEQTDRVCQNIAAVLAEAGMTMQDVIKTTCFLVSMEDFAEFNEAYARWFAHKPARSCVAVRALPKGVRVEIEVIAAAD